MWEDINRNNDAIYERQRPSQQHYDKNSLETKPYLYKGATTTTTAAGGTAVATSLRLVGDNNDGMQ